MATTRGRRNLKPARHRAPLTWIQNVDDDASFKLRSTCKYRQYNTVRDCQIYADATLIERDGPDIIIETPGKTGSKPRRWRISEGGD